MTDTAKSLENIREIGSTEFDDAIAAASADGLDVLVWFSTPWCGPCKQLAPALDTVAGRLPNRLLVVMVNADESLEIADRFQVTVYPTLTLFHHGRRVWQDVFPRGLDELDEFLRQLLDVVAEVDPDGASSPERAARPDRMISVPKDLPSNVRVMPYRPSLKRAANATPVAPGSTLRMSAGSLVQVALDVDHRQVPPVAVDVLRRFDPGSIDTLRLHVSDQLRPEDVLVPSLSDVSEIYLSGRGSLDPAVVDALTGYPGLRNIVYTGGELGSGIDRDTTAVDGRWVSPELRGRLAEPEDPSAGSTEDAGVTPLDGVVRISGGELDLTVYHGPTIICFWMDGRSQEYSPDRLIAEFAREHGLPVVAIDIGDSQAFQATWAIDPPWACLLVRDGRVVWVNTSFMPNRMTDILRMALDKVMSVDPQTAGELRQFVPRPARTLNLPEGPLDFTITLLPPGQPQSEGTRIKHGGAVEVPAGWRVIVSAPDAALWPQLDALAPDGVDMLGMYDKEPAPSAASETLARLTGLQHLQLRCPLSQELLATITALPDLRCLDCDASGYELVALRKALPRAIVNNEWLAPASELTGGTTTKY